MPPNSGQTRLSGIVYILFLVIFLIIGVMAYKLPPYLPVLLIICLSLFLVALLKPDFALVILILAMLLSPEFYLGGITGRSVTFRFDDALIFVSY
jgi:Na+/H+ antiporter NhaC